MYHEFRDTNRTGWKYGYKGSELIEVAKNRQAFYRKKELTARDKMAELLTDRTISPSDDRMKQLEQDIQSFGSTAEQCDVFVHEFGRNPDREFQLSLGDVVFFALQ